MSRFLHNGFLWSPTILRGALWVFIAMGKCYIDAMHNAGDKVDGWGWVQWTVLLVSIGVEGGIAARLYLDQSLANHKQLINANENKAAAGIAPNV